VPWPSVTRPIDCIIPAKGRSTRFPGKNLAEINGVPLIGHVIEAARMSRIFGQVAVSTEDEAIGKVSKDFGARVIERPKELARDEIQVKEVVLHALSVLDAEYENMGVPRKNWVAVIYPTAALITPKDVADIWERLVEKGTTFGVMTVVRPAEHASGALSIENGYLKPYFEKEIPQSQQWPELWMDAGAIYMYSRIMFQARGFYVPELLPYELPRTRVVDVDYLDDLSLVEALLAQERREKGE